ncbi:SDR family NAD(P)-dependent oxidoreductase [Synechococcus sp. CBW1107]|uniref:SDR family NAD(P)-dependent oxidoreductase n=1 Tax=Synechococcus sp. CBW1107 TaxID=2789857 RepID=UPI002AD3994E|nr:SDR family NAD(P)-dependent oxidoreductase [Synechococcus sp. CBW1107]CAK6693895.1 NAD-dependent glycerol dehydrogenase [Synechococcus sp. CBW1107]
MKDFRLDGQRALISGGSKGLGAAIAETFAEAGADIGVIGRNTAGLHNTKRLVEGKGRHCDVITADLACAEGAQRAGDKALELCPAWDVLVNNAGIAAIVKPILETSQAEWDETFDLNLRSVLLLSQALVPQMIARGSGKIVNISSIGAFVGSPGLSAYAASKAALNQLTRTMAVEWGPHKIHVNAICPTVILTDMGHAIWDKPAMKEQRELKEKRIPLHRFGEPKEVANVALFLASAASDFIHGVSLPLDGGMTISP